ncbi:hypothetical protein Y919_09225 [Caloranaerobacter azorensis H53214]|uniref:Uncharacterized protein n=1 Tax=Caloranaerobacter azorensis H53214 TaxID=1156417 RepID=A0A096CTL9_9FIRM|nr:hypothetical protein Y919_09225 [Caloranaerobacter azorensis H53214]
MKILGGVNIHRVFLNEQDFCTKLKEIINKHESLRLKQDGNKCEIIAISKLRLSKNILSKRYC